MTSLPERLLAFLQQTGKPVSVRELVRQLELEKTQRDELDAALRSMAEQGLVVEIRGGRVGLPQRMNLVVGRLTCNPAGFGFVVPERKTAEELARSGRADVYVSAGNLKDAMHGDRVVVRVEHHTPKGAEGTIIRVLERGLTRLVGRYEDDGRFGGHVVPFDKRVLHELLVAQGDALLAQPGQMVLAEITQPPTGKRGPAGRVLEVLGSLDDPGVDLKVVMAKYGLPDAFPPEVEAYANDVPTAVGEAERKGRTDFRPWDTVTIDPETARDHDDAISLDHMANGNWLLAVHIADVAHYVPVGSVLDQEAYLRGTSVYFPDRVVPMLPHALSSNICSLVEGQDRLTQSVVLELDRQGKPVKAEFHDGVIRVAAMLSYQQAQAIADGDVETRARYPKLVPLIERMVELARLMRKRRFSRGALDLDMPEPKLVLDEQGNMTAIRPSERLESMRVIEEFMLAANEIVAERLDSASVGALYRVHEQPDPGRVEEFCDLAASFGYKLPQNIETIRPQDFQLVLRQIEGKPEEKLVRYLLLRTMKLARYHEDNLGHFGLATDMYAHFTSPIRRYPDLIVHRALRALARHRTGELPERQALGEMALHLSEMERRASEAERELVEWKKVRFMAGKLGEVYQGYVTGVHAFGLFVELEDVYVQGLVHVSSMSDDYYRFDERAHRLKGENTDQVYRLGDKVKVQVARVDQERRQVDFALLDVLERARAGATKPMRHEHPSGKPTPRKTTGKKPSQRPPKPARKGAPSARQRRKR